MPKTFVDGREVKKWWVDGRQVKKAYLDGRLIHEAEYFLNLTVSDHNIGTDWAWARLPDSVKHDPTYPVRIIVHTGTELITVNPSIRGVFDFYGEWGNRKVTIENYGHILGRGGAGGSWAGKDGMQGGRAIYNEGVQLSIINRGYIAGGGGGGGVNIIHRMPCGGSGGAPFGAYGVGQYNVAYDGQEGKFSGRTPATHIHNITAGTYGGDWGESGQPWQSGLYGTGAAGEATRGAINWAVLGDVRGGRY